VFTARYALSPYIKQIRFVFKVLIFVNLIPYIPPVRSPTSTFTLEFGHFGHAHLIWNIITNHVKRPELLKLWLSWGIRPVNLKKLLSFVKRIIWHTSRKITCSSEGTSSPENKRSFRVLTHFEARKVWNIRQLSSTWNRTAYQQHRPHKCTLSTVWLLQFPTHKVQVMQ
jgi:hypothetical protein